MIMPFVVDQGCLRCHRSEGYRVGDTRGGISIAVPMGRYYAAEAQTRRTIAATHGLLWLIVSGGLLVFTARGSGRTGRSWRTSGSSGSFPTRDGLDVLVRR